MSTENSFNQANNLIHQNSNEYKGPSGMPDKLKDAFRSISDGDTEELEQLLVEGSSFSQRSMNVFLEKALAQHQKGMGPSSQMISLLLRFKADPNTKISSREKRNASPTGLMLACMEDQRELVETFLNHLAEVNVKDNLGRNCMFYLINSSSGGRMDIAQLLLQHSININEVDVNGQTPLTLAIAKGQNDLVQLLLYYGADVDHVVSRDGNTPLHYAVLHNKPELINVLLKKQPNLHMKNYEGFTAVDIAFRNSKTEIYQLLAEEYHLRVNQEVETREEPQEHLLRVELPEEAELISNTNHSQGQQRVMAEFGYQAEFGSHPNKLNSSKQFTNPNSFVKDIGQTYGPTTQSSQNINIRNLVNSRSVTKSSKRDRIMQLHEKKKAHEEKGIKDKMFKFPFGQNGSGTNIEIPFSFQNNQEQSNGTGPNRQTRSNQLHTFIKIQSTPILHIDISDESKQDQFMLSSQLEDLKLKNINMSTRLSQQENEIGAYMEENSSLKSKLARLSEELKMKDQKLHSLHNEFNSKELEYSTNLVDMKKKIDEKNYTIKSLYEKLEKQEKELYDKKTSFSRSSGESCKSLPSMPKMDMLEKKFSNSKYDEKYIIKCLQRDILDFQEFTKVQIQRIKSVQEQLIGLVQQAVDECMPDYEVKLYGSHATNLCLQWSDLDVVLIHKKNYNSNNYGLLQNLYLNLREKQWKKSIKLIESAAIPLIKMQANDEYNVMHIDISIQDNKHYGLKCVELVKSFMQEYEALEPLIFGLKNILKNANLNDPYTGGLSSYGLILMVVSFLQNQQENKKSIKLGEGNLGRMFLEFLWYYGVVFDHNKYVIYAYPPYASASERDNINFLYNLQPSHDLIIVDPLNKSNNVARSTYQFVNIKMAFMIGFVVSHEECECGCHYGKYSEGLIVATSEHCILKRIFNSVKRFNTSNQGGA